MRVDMLSLAFRPSNRPCMFIHYDSVYFCTCPVVSTLSSLAHGSPWQDHFSGASMLSPAPVSETIQQLGCMAPVHLWHCRMVAAAHATRSDLGMDHTAQFCSAVVEQMCRLPLETNCYVLGRQASMTTFQPAGCNPMKISVDRGVALGRANTPHATIFRRRHATLVLQVAKPPWTLR